MMDHTSIIEKEAARFHENHLSEIFGRRTSNFHLDVSAKMEEFYENEHKLIFLDTLLSRTKEVLKDHRDKHHYGESVETCPFESNGERFLFYMTQERNLYLSNHNETSQLKSDFYWRGSPAELLELIVAVTEAGNIVNRTGTTVRKEILSFFSEMLNIELNNVEQNISAMKKRKTAATPYLNKLIRTFEIWRDKKFEK